MASPEPPVLRRWDGKTRTAVTWSTNTQEPKLCPPDANCSIYLSDEEVQQKRPSFKVRFNQLVANQCQPLVQRLNYVTESSATPGPSQPTWAAKGQGIWKVPSMSWSCSLVLTPSKAVGEDQVLRYHVTTRNFFAWIAGSDIVGTDPISALVALKYRMDIWRDSSCNNVATLQEYIGLRSYGHLAGQQLVTATALRQGVPFIPTDYRLVSVADEPSGAKAPLSKIAQFRMSFGKHAESMLKRKSDTSTTQGTPSSNPTPAVVSVRQTGFNDRMTMSGALTDNPSSVGTAHLKSLVDEASWSASAYDAVSEMGKQSDSSAATTTTSSGDNNTPSTNTSPDAGPRLLEADSRYGPVVKDFGAQPSWPLDLGTNQSQSTNGSLSLLPAPIGTPQPYSNTPHRYSLSIDRRRLSSHSRPPSPIMEETFEHPKRRPMHVARSTNASSKKFSFSIPRGRRGSDSQSIASTASVKTLRQSSPPSQQPTRQLSQKSTQLFSSQPIQYDKQSIRSTASGRRSTESVMGVCATCKKCKKPCSPALHAVTQSSADSTTHIVPVLESLDTRASTLIQQMSSREPRMSSASKIEHKQEEPKILTRFPSLRRRERDFEGSSLTAIPTTVPKPPPDTNSRVARRLNKMRSFSQGPPVTRSIMSEVVGTERPSRRSMDSAPLSNQRYDPLAQTSSSRRQGRGLSGRTNVHTEQHPPARIGRPITQNPPPRNNSLTGQPPTHNVPSSEQHSAIYGAPPSKLQTSQDMFRQEKVHVLEPVQLAESRKSQELTPRAARLRADSFSKFQPNSKRSSMDIPTFPEPQISVIMKSDGGRVSLSLPRDDRVSVDTMHIRPTEQTYYDLTNRDDQIILDQVLNGFQGMHKAPQTTEPRCVSKPQIPDKSASRVPALFRQASSTSAQKRASKALTEKPKKPSWVGSIRKWMLRDKGNIHSHVDADSHPQPRGKGSEMQVRVLTLDNNGHFSTSLMESTVGRPSDYH